MQEVSDIKRFCIYANKWCPRRGLDSSKLYQYFVANGMEAVDSPQKADLVVVYTCGLFALNEESSILTIENALKNNHAKVIITGCLPKIDPQRLKNYEKADIILTENIDRIDSIIKAKVKLQDSPDAFLIKGINELCHQRNIRPNILAGLEKKLNNRFFKRSEDILFSRETYKIEIAKSCLGNCSYCAIKLGMERFHSFPEEKILQSFKQGLDRGFKNFALIAGDIGCYGVDIQSSLPSLLTRLLAVNGDYKILLWDLSPGWFVKYYPELRSILSANAAKISKIIVPLESGSDRVLKLMNRAYQIETVKDCFNDLLSIMPGIQLETQIIIGFPGETEEDFQKSLKLAKEVNFSKVTVFRYEDRPNTASSKMLDKISKNTINERVKLMAHEVKSIVIN